MTPFWLAVIQFEFWVIVFILAVKSLWAIFKGLRVGYRWLRAAITGDRL